MCSVQTTHDHLHSSAVLKGPSAKNAEEKRLHLYPGKWERGICATARCSKTRVVSLTRSNMESGASCALVSTGTDKHVCNPGPSHPKCVFWRFLRVGNWCIGLPNPSGMGPYAYMVGRAGPSRHTYLSPSSLSMLPGCSFPNLSITFGGMT